MTVVAENKYIQVIERHVMLFNIHVINNIMLEEEDEIKDMGVFLIAIIKLHRSTVY